MLCEEGEPLAWGRSTGWHAMLGASLYHRVDVYVLLNAMFCASLYSYKATYLPSFFDFMLHPLVRRRRSAVSKVEEGEAYMQYWQAMVPERKKRALPKK